MEGTHALMSFLITRRADPEIDVVGKEGKEYYQPVTIRLSAHHAKVLEPLARAVNRPDDVRKAMSEVMARATRADNVFLATKLARPSGEDSQQVTEAATEAKEDTTETAFEAPNSLLPL